MYTFQIVVLALTAAATVSAHGKVTSIHGNEGGNGTGFGIKGGVVARFGKNSATEKDTTVFGGNANKPMTDGLGKTAADGKLTVAKSLSQSMALSGNTLPQVSNDGSGTLTGTWQTVTSDGTANNKAGELFAVLDASGTGQFSKGTQLVATSNMVGNGNGNVVQRWVTRALKAVGIQRRATNVGADATFSVTVPAGTTCTGTDATSGASNFCLMKVANNNKNGPFGSTFAFQVTGTGTTGGSTTNTTSTATSPTQAAKGNNKNNRREVSFEA